MPTFNVNVRRQIDAAEAWITLGDWHEASEELRRIPAEFQSAAEVTRLRCEIAVKAERWSELETIAKRAVELHRDEPSFVTDWACALYRLGKPVEALKIVEQAAERFGKCTQVTYSAAVLNGALGRMAEAGRWLEQTLKCANNPKKVKLRAMKQPELTGLWKKTGGKGPI